MFCVYGDESIVKGIVAYGLVIAPESQLEALEGIIRDVKGNYGVPPNVEFHCKETFHPDSRKKSGWSHLNQNQCYQFALDLTVSLGGKGLMTTVGHLSTNDLGKTLPPIGSLKPFVLEDSKQLVPFAFLAAAGPLHLDPKFKGKMKLWIDPDSSMVKWWGRSRQAQRLLSVGELDSELLKRADELAPENLQTREKPTMLEIADLLSYSSARALAKQGKKFDYVFEEIFRLIGPVTYPLKWLS